MHMIIGTKNSSNPRLICLVPAIRCMFSMQNNVMNEVAARPNNIPTFFRGNNTPLFCALMELNKKARRRAKLLIAPMSLMIINEICMPLYPSIHTAFCGVPVKKPIDWTVMSASAKRQKTMTAPVSHLRDLVVFVS